MKIIYASQHHRYFNIAEIYLMLLQFIMRDVSNVCICSVPTKLCKLPMNTIAWRSRENNSFKILFFSTCTFSVIEGLTFIRWFVQMFFTQFKSSILKFLWVYKLALIWNLDISNSYHFDLMVWVHKINW